MRDTMRNARPMLGSRLRNWVYPCSWRSFEDREEHHKKLTPAQLSERQRQPIPFHVTINPH
jgi:hypothetical protein